MFLRADVFSSKQARVNGPCTWPDHGCGSAESCEDHRHPRITGLCEGDPQFDAGDQRSDHRCPETEEKNYPGTGANDLGKCRCGNGCRCELENPQANENDGSQKALEQKADPWPTVGEGGKKPLHKPSDQIVRELQRDRNASKSGPVVLLLGEIQLDDAAFQSNSYGVRPIIGPKLGQNI